MPTTCFMVSPTDVFRLSLRRYRKLKYDAEHKHIPEPCPAQPKRWGHDATIVLAEAREGTAKYKRLLAEWLPKADWISDPEWARGHGYSTNTGKMRNRVWFKAHKKRWPTACVCGYEFVAEDEWSIDWQDVWKRDDTGESVGVYPHQFPPGAMHFAPWYDRMWQPQLEHCLEVILPNGHGWVIDSQANNCTMPEDSHQRAHHCWSIDGVPPVITAGKRGPTCSAGAGSIQAGDYHGFLQNGVLSP